MPNKLLKASLQWRTAAILSGLVLAAALAHGAADSWPEFRGPTGQGISSATNVPVRWSTTNNVVWRTEIPGQGWSSPVVAQGRIYLTTALAGNGGTVSLEALCINAADGTMRWTSKVFEAEASSAGTRHKKNSAASATPLARG